MEALQKKMQQIKEKMPAYEKILDFYGKVREEQERIRAPLRMEPPPISKERKSLLARKGFSLLRKEDFPVDIERGDQLFKSLCNIARDANPFLSEQVRKIEGAIKDQKLKVKEILGRKPEGEEIKRVAEALGLDEKVLLFLIENSLKPFVEAGAEQLAKEIESENWLRGICPICGSLPFLSLLRGEAGKRSLLCSFCGTVWETERLLCPFCNNRKQERLHYLYTEEGACRIDLCEECHQYIKTIDLRKTELPDPSLEDLVTLHLDMVARERGYQRPAPVLFSF